MVDVVDRAHPADPHVRRRLAALDADGLRGERKVVERLQLPAREAVGLQVEGGADRGRRDALAPGDELLLRVEARVDAIGAGGVVVAVADVVLARPLHAHRRPDRARQQRRLDDEIGLRLAAEAAAQERDVHRHLRGFEAERLSDLLLRGLRVLRRGPDLARALADASRRRPAAPSACGRGAGRGTRRSPPSPRRRAPRRRRPPGGSPCPARSRPRAASAGRRPSRSSRSDRPPTRRRARPCP